MLKLTSASDEAATLKLKGFTMIIERNERPDLWAILKRALPSYKKHSFFVHHQNEVTPNGTSWDGGSKTSWITCNSIGGGTQHAKLGANTGWPNFKQPDPLVVTDARLVISFGTFRGKPDFASLYLPYRPQSQLRVGEAPSRVID